MEVSRTIAASPDRVWSLLVDLDAWPEWGPSVRRAVVDGGGRTLTAGATGRVETPLGVELPFRVTEFDDGRRWSWQVAGLTATTHEVVPVDAGALASFGIPRWAPFYAPVCRVALRRLERLAT